MVSEKSAFKTHSLPQVGGKKRGKERKKKTPEVEYSHGKETHEIKDITQFPQRQIK